MSRIARRLAATTAALLVLPLAAAAPAPAWTAYDRPAEHATVHERDVEITMSDGVVLVADVIRPQAPGRYPVLLQQTPYNKQLITSGGLFGDVGYFAARGYAVVVADVRGTGGSQGTWDSFGDREQRDGPELVAWAARQPWSDGRVGLFGASYMALNQLYTAARRPPALEAIFPVVPLADGYRDIAMSGGQVNTGFIPLWLGLVTGGSIVPPSYALSGDADDLVRAATTLTGHLAGAGTFQLPTVVSSATGGDVAFDGPFWRMRSPLEVVDRIDVPAFVVGGLHDIFQRGAPLVYERLKRRVDARLLVGPWTHVEAGSGLPTKEIPATLPQIQLRWFDHHLKGLDTGADAIPRVTQYTLGSGRYETQQEWPDPRIQPIRLHLRAESRLTRERPATAEPPDAFVQQPVSGICTRSTEQWSAGLAADIPCTDDGRLDESAGVTYTTEPLPRDLRISGPALANLWVRSSARDAVVAVRVHDVAPDGTPTELTAGWLAASFRETDRTRSRVVRNRLLQPWHPFTRASAQPLTPGEAVEMPVEVFPTNAVIRKGHRLKVSVTPSDFPHSVPPLPQFAGTLAGRVEILHDGEHPSSVVLPRVGQRCPGTKKRAGCRPLPVPDLVRG